MTMLIISIRSVINYNIEHLEKDDAIVPIGQNIKYTLRLCLLEGQNLHMDEPLTQWMNLPVLSLYNTLKA